jgi:hypothetical protein
MNLDAVRAFPGVEFFNPEPGWDDSTILRRRVADGRLIIVNQMIGFTQLAIGPADGETWDWAYRYEQPFAALLAALAWEPSEDYPFPVLGWFLAQGPGYVQLGPDLRPLPEEEP